MTIEDAANWIYATQVSTTIRETTWIVPTVQSIHILAIAIVVGSVLVTDLRLAGMIATDETPHAVARRYLPWIGWAIVALVATGLVMTVGEPERVLANPTFWIKMTLFAAALTMTALFRRPLVDPRFSLDHARWRHAVKPLAWLSLVTWIGIICCGRWIAYSI